MNGSKPGSVTGEATQPIQEHKREASQHPDMQKKEAISKAATSTEQAQFANLTPQQKRRRLIEIALVFVKLGLVAFGGPAAHIAMMEEEAVTRRKWISRQSFLDMLGATNLLPGPNSTEMAIHIGFTYGGGLGLLLAGLGFLLPAVVIVLVLAMVYQQQGQLPLVEGILAGIKPVVLAVVFHALLRLVKTVIKGWLPGITAAFALMLYLLGVPEIPLLLLAGFTVMAFKNRGRIVSWFTNKSWMVPVFPAFVASQATSQIEKVAAALSVPGIFFTFLKIGSFLYGSGYVLLAFLEAEFVSGRALITSRQLLDAVAVGQFTPGPVFTTATFVGYLMAGTPGALAATAGIFLPAFVLVFLLNPYIPKMRASTWFGAALDGINAASLALMAAVSLRLVPDTLPSLLPVILFLLSFLALWRTKLSSFWMILVGGVIGGLFL